MIALDLPEAFGGGHPGPVTPLRIVLHAIRRIGHHQVRSFTDKEFINCVRISGVAADDAVVPEDPQIVSTTDRLTRYRRDVVGLVLLCPGPQLAELDVREPS